MPEKEAAHKINNLITAQQVRVVGDNIQVPTVVSLKEALAMADEQGLDLVEISPKADPPVCRIVDYSKFLYQQKKKAKELKAKAVKVVIKEIRFGPNTDDHDYNFKLKHAENFLKDGDKVKAYVFFRGRRSFSRIREKSCCCVLPPTSKSGVRWSRCPSWRASG